MLRTKSAIKSKELLNYIKGKKILKSCKFFKINGSEIIDLVESEKFIANKQYYKKIIKKILNDIISKNSIDTIILSSIHLPFLKSLLDKKFSNVQFIEPRNIVVQKIFKII